MWLSAVFDWACSTKCTCYRARQIRVLGSHKIALSRIWTRGLAICLQAKPTFAIGKVLQHRSFAGASRRKAMPNMGTEIAARCAYWHQETCWTYIWARSKPWPSSSNLKMWRCTCRHHGHEPENFWRSRSRTLPPMNKVEQSWQGFQPLSSIPKTEMARKFCFAKINSHGCAFEATVGLLFVGMALFSLVITDVSLLTLLRALSASCLWQGLPPQSETLQQLWLKESSRISINYLLWKCLKYDVINRKNDICNHDNNSNRNICIHVCSCI